VAVAGAEKLEASDPSGARKVYAEIAAGQDALKPIASYQKSLQHDLKAVGATEYDVIGDDGALALPHVYERKIEILCRASAGWRVSTSCSATRRRREESPQRQQAARGAGAHAGVRQPAGGRELPPARKRLRESQARGQGAVREARRDTAEGYLASPGRAKDYYDSPGSTRPA